MKSAIWLVSDYSKIQGIYLHSAEGKGGVPITWHLFVTITRQLILKLVPIVCFVAIQTITMAKREGINWSLFEYSTSSRCLQCLGGSVVSIQEWNIFNTSMPRFMFTIFGTKKNRASIHAWCWHEKKKSESWPQAWYTESRCLIRWCLYRRKWWRTNHSWWSYRK